MKKNSLWISLKNTADYVNDKFKKSQQNIIVTRITMMTGQQK